MRPTTDLLNLEFVFSQQAPLTPSKFIEAFEQRVLAYEFCLSDWEQLEELHRVGALVPLFRFKKNTRPLLDEAHQRKLPATFVWLDRDVYFAMSLYENKEIGTLIDPQIEAYKTWYSYMHSYKTAYLYPNDSTNEEKMGSFWESSFFYSLYQLLLIPKLRNLLWQMHRHRRRQKHPSIWKFRLRLNERQQKEILKEATENRELMIALTALEAKYLPKLKGHHFSAVYSGFDDFVEELRAYQRSFNPTVILDWIGWDADKVKNTAEKLLWQADKLDPLGDWYELVRMCHPDMLNRLRGDALIALDHRRAAEMLLRFYEDLQAHDAAPPFEDVPKRFRGPHNTRLKYDLGTLDEVLMEFGLSPQPVVVLIIEGETEEYIVPKTMKLLGIPQYSSFIQTFNIKGGDKDLELLARYIVPPQLGDALENAVLLTRPPTHFFVAVDAEKTFSNADKRKNKHKSWVDKIYEALPTEYHTENLRNDLDYLVHIETWDDDVFEFAHFTDEELAQALLITYAGSESPSLAYLIAKVKQMRESSEHKNIEKILGTWNSEKKQDNPDYIRGREVHKTDLAVVLWPILEKKILEAPENDRHRIPIVKVLSKAYDLAASTHRKDVVVRR
jgi:hypothetical protein